MKHSGFPLFHYYQEVARRIGKDTMQFWLDSLELWHKKNNEPELLILSGWIIR